MKAEEVLFNASSSGALLTEKQGQKFTDVQFARIKELENERDLGINVNGNKVKFDGTKKPEELSELIHKRDAPPELSDTAKTLVRKIWLRNEKGIYKNIKSKFLDKGIFQEETSISLVTEVEGVLYVKNEIRKTNEYFTGECDIDKQFEDKRLIIDTKTSWDAETFMEAKPSLDNIVQGQIYLELYNADEFELKFCLVDTPTHLIQREKDTQKYKYYSGDMTDAELDLLEKSMQPIYDQIDRNMIFSDNPNIDKKECIKTFYFKRDREMYAKLVEKVELARIYYATLTLNTKI
jgi:hypothetical protein